MKKKRVLSGVGCLLAAVLVLSLWGLREYRDRKEQEHLQALAQAKLDAIRAIPEERLVFALFNPVPLEGVQWALVTESMKAQYEAVGYERTIVADEEHYAALRSLIDSLAVLQTEYVGTPPTDGGGYVVRFYDGDAEIGDLRLRINGQAECYFKENGGENVCHFVFSMNKECAKFLLSALGRSY